MGLSIVYAVTRNRASDQARIVRTRAGHMATWAAGVQPVAAFVALIP